MSEHEKILSAVKQHPEYKQHVDAVNVEMEFLQKHELVQEVFVLFNSKKVGHENKINSIIAYLLGITTCRPSGPFDLQPRRTYARAGWPDIDMDFDYLRREEVFDYIFDKYGRENSSHIGSVITLKTKGAVRQCIKVLDPANAAKFDNSGKLIKSEQNLSYQLENEILSTLPTLMKRDDGTLVDSVKAAYKEYPMFRKYMDEYPHVYKAACAVEGTISAWGIHPAGIVLSPIPLSHICPLHQTSDKQIDDASLKMIGTQYSMEDVEALGLIKFDILGLKTKTAIDWACKEIKSSYGIDIDWRKINQNDAAVYDLINSGKTSGCFQLEQPGMQDALRTIGVDRFDDIVAVIAMYRPGPKDYIPEYAKRKRKEVPTKYLHPLMKDITGDTYGIICFQEQLMSVFMKIAGLTASDGYNFMKGCAKKKPELIEKYHDPFIKGGLAQGSSKDVLEKIFDDSRKYGQYCFNKAHAVSYALEAYKTAYLKTHYPTEFFAARLSVETLAKDFDKVEKYTRDAVRSFGFKIDPPDLNLSKMKWTIIKDKHLRSPLLIKGVGEKIVQEIINLQPFDPNDTLNSFINKSKANVHKKTMEAMYDCGLWNFLKVPKDKFLTLYETLKSDMKKGVPRGDIF